MRKTPAIYHAPAFFLQSIDRIQETFLNELGVTAFEALSEYNLAHLSSRRDISMLGLIHRVVLGKAPSQFSKFFYVACGKSSTRG